MSGITIASRSNRRSNLCITFRSSISWQGIHGAHHDSVSRRTEGGAHRRSNDKRKSHHLTKCSCSLPTRALQHRTSYMLLICVHPRRNEIGEPSMPQRGKSASLSSTLPTGAAWPAQDSNPLAQGRAHPSSTTGHTGYTRESLPVQVAPTPPPAARPPRGS